MIIMNLDLNQTMKKKEIFSWKHKITILKSKKIQLFTPNQILAWAKKRIHSDFLLLQLVYMLYC